MTARENPLMFGQVPVLFRLPYLDPPTQTAPRAELTAAAELRSDPTSEAVFEIETKVNPNPVDPNPVKRNPMPPIAPAPPTATSVAMPGQFAVAPACDKATWDPRERFEQWMQRFGARLVLAFTLLVIAASAYLIGRRMPGSHAAPASAAEPSSIASHAERESIPIEEATADAPSTIANQSKRDREPAEPSRDSTVREPYHLAESTESIAEPIQLSPPQASLSNRLEPSFYEASSVDSHWDAEPHSALDDGPYFSSADTTLDQPSGGNRTVSTTTPHAPVLDPFGDVDAMSPGVARGHAMTSTPHAIVDWTRYLSGIEESPAVRSVGVTPDDYQSGGNQRASFESGDATMGEAPQPFYAP